MLSPLTALWELIKVAMKVGNEYVCVCRRVYAQVVLGLDREEPTFTVSYRVQEDGETATSLVSHFLHQVSIFMSRSVCPSQRR